MISRPGTASAIVIASLSLIALGCQPSATPGQQSAPTRSSREFLADETAAVLDANSAGRLSSDAIKALEAEVAKNPADIGARTKILGYYFANRGSKSTRRESREHVLWLIRNAPGTPILGTPYGEIDYYLYPKLFAAGKKAWRAQMDKHPSNLRVLASFANYMQHADIEQALEALAEAFTLDPDNPLWPTRIGGLHRLAIIGGSPEAQVKSAELALEHFEIAYRQTKGIRQVSLLNDLASMALAANQLDKAKRYAEEMLRRRTVAGRLDDSNLHHGNVALGLIALRNDAVDDAKQHLLEAGRTPESPALRSFGPNMMLAKELLQRGEKEVVLRYLEQCSTFWVSGKDQLNQWSELIRAGKTPDFGSNLRY
ncbi:MAG: RNA polymerase subunit sigma-24 [Planctomycetota bacterium]